LHIRRREKNKKNDLEEEEKDKICSKKSHQAFLGTKKTSTGFFPPMCNLDLSKYIYACCRT